MGKFDDLLYELGEELDAPLHVDENNVCCLEINETVLIQLQTNIPQSELIICCQVMEILPGTFREATLKSILRANDAENSQIGTFSFLPKPNLLFLHHQLPMDQLSGTRLVEILVQFSERAVLWRSAIEGGASHPEGALAPLPTDTPGGLQMGIKT